MMKVSLLGMGLGLLLLVSPVGAQESDALASAAERESAFLKKARVEPSQTVVYMRVVTQEEFEALKKAQPNLAVSRSQKGDVAIVQETSAAEIAVFAKSKKEDSEAPSSASSLPPATQPKSPVKHTVYKRVVPFAEYEQMQLAATKNKGQSRTMKMMIDDLVIFSEISPEEAEADKRTEVPRKEWKGLSFPVFQLKSLDGREVDEKIFQSKLTLINFFFDKCAPCIEETPALNQFAKDHPDIQVIAMTFDKREQAQKYLDTHHFAWPIVFDASKLILKDLAVSSFPSFILVDETGKILGVKNGVESENGVDKNVYQWIEKLRQ